MEQQTNSLLKQIEASDNLVVLVSKSCFDYERSELTNVLFYPSILKICPTAVLSPFHQDYLSHDNTRSNHAVNLTLALKKVADFKEKVFCLVTDSVSDVFERHGVNQDNIRYLRGSLTMMKRDFEGVAPHYKAIWPEVDDLSITQTRSIINGISGSTILIYISGLDENKSSKIHQLFLNFDTLNRFAFWPNRSNCMKNNEIVGDINYITKNTADIITQKIEGAKTNESLATSTTRIY